ncbi:hypothetical protein [Lentzea sp. NPDC051838]|uniref:hypothetical protein n=1 Tax=Lentzea sp. NPDC051838 TaxID=3154849 RepID=UPI00344851A3
MKKSLVALAVLSTAFALTPIANAQEPVTPYFEFRQAPRPGASFSIFILNGTCPGGPVSITSPGFAGPVDLSTLTGTFVNVKGAQTATLKCKDTAETGERPFFLHEAPPSTDHYLDKEEYAPGEKIEVYLEPSWKCQSPATSAGFTAPAQLTRYLAPGGGIYSLVGETTAVSTPGTYYASLRCSSGPTKDTMFKVKAAPSTPPVTTPPTTTSPTPKPGAKPVVKPKGAPQTGGGGTA